MSQLIDMDIASMYPSMVTGITTQEMETLTLRVLKNRTVNGNNRYYKWKIPTPNHFEEHEDLFEL